jgi:DNA-binding transcriptional ArsR family regulator
MNLESILGTKSRITILRHLCEHQNSDFSVSELAEATGEDKSLVSRIVSSLEKEKIIRAHKRRNLKLCQINTANGTYNMLCDIFTSEKKLNSRRGKFPWST